MVVDGQNRREPVKPGGSNNDLIFFMQHPYPFLKHWYGAFSLPQQDTGDTGTVDLSPASAGVDRSMEAEISSGAPQSKLPHLSPSKAVVFIQLLYCPM